MMVIKCRIGTLKNLVIDTFAPKTIFIFFSHPEVYFGEA